METKYLKPKAKSNLFVRTNVIKGTKSKKMVYLRGIKTF